MSIFGCKCISVDTIQSLLDEGTDILASVLSDVAGIEERDLRRDALMSMYRYRMIGSCDVERWAQRMRDRVAELEPAWSRRFMLWQDTLLDSEFSDLHDRVRTVTDESETSLKETVDSEREDIPETANAMDTKYLSERSAGTKDTDGESSRTVTEKERTGLAWELFKRSIVSIPNPYREWANEFDELFLRMW